MPWPARIFQIENGEFAFSVVDTERRGYADTWQAPNGATLRRRRSADYDTDAAHWMCQVTSAALNASPNQNEVTVPATFCQASARWCRNPAITSYSLDGEFLQDPNILTGLSQFLFENDTEEAYFLLGLDGGDRAARRSAGSG